jgi:hypothetical protein
VDSITGDYEIEMKLKIEIRKFLLFTWLDAGLANRENGK